MTCSCKPNRRKIAKAATRAKLIATAQQLWAEPGSYEPVTIRVIAKAAGLSTGAIFANFTGKEDLWQVAMGYPAPRDCPEVRAALQAAAAQARWPEQDAA